MTIVRPHPPFNPAIHRPAVTNPPLNRRNTVNNSRNNPASTDPNTGLLILPDPHPEPARPEPPQAGPLHTPDDLPALHRQLLEQANALAADGDPWPWMTAASKVEFLWEAWRVRMHATAQQEALATVATTAVTATLAALRLDTVREQREQFDLAQGWIAQLRMLVPARPPRATTIAQPEGLFTRLFGRRRTSTAVRVRTR
jgi:hypothetical protein